MFDRYWAGLILAEPRLELFERWRELEAMAGPEVRKNAVPLIYFNTVDDFEAARARYAVEAEWYRVRGEEGWLAERTAHAGFTEFLARALGPRRGAPRGGVRRGRPARPPGAMDDGLPERSFVDAGRGRADRAREALQPLIEGAERTGQSWWEALLLSSLAFVEFAAGDHEAVVAR